MFSCAVGLKVRFIVAGSGLSAKRFLVPRFCSKNSFFIPRKRCNRHVQGLLRCKTFGQTDDLSILTVKAEMVA